MCYWVREMNQPSLLPEFAGRADFSSDGLYRYQLIRTWDSTKPIFTYIGLNPSTADAEHNDATTIRNLKRAIAAGAGGYIAVNLFVWVATSPKDMKSAAEPVGGRNDSAIVDAVTKSKWVLCGWGNHGNHRDRNRDVGRLLWSWPERLYYLEMNKNGNPKHPLYIREEQTLKPFVIQDRA